MSPPARPNACLPEGPISPFDIACASYLYESMTDYARSLDRFRTRIGVENDLDLTKEDHRYALLKFLNDWGCRNLAKDWHGLAAVELERWYCGARERLDSFGGPLSALDARSRRDLVDVFDELSTPIVARKKSKGHEVIVSFGPTAASKTLFVLRPSLFPAWDGPICKKLGYERDGESYAQFAKNVHDKIDESEQRCKQRGFILEGLPRILGRPSYTTLVQLFIEYYWITLTRGVSLRGRAEISEWLSWCAPPD
jgi:hypothetical protein